MALVQHWAREATDAGEQRCVNCGIDLCPLSEWPKHPIQPGMAFEVITRTHRIAVGLYEMMEVRNGQRIPDESDHACHDCRNDPVMLLRHCSHA